MIERVVTSGEPMLYISTRTSARSSSIAATIKASLGQVRSFMEEYDIVAAGRPLAVFTDWNGRLVTVEAGYPVSRDALALARGRIQAGQTPEGPAARTSAASGATDHALDHEDFAEALRTRKLRLTGTSWEVYPADGDDGTVPTELYAQLIETTTGGESAKG